MKKYVVRLTDVEREICKETIERLPGSGQKARRARILLQVDTEGPAWMVRRVADAFRCRVKTVENVRQRCELEGKQRSGPPVPKPLDGEQEAKLIALRLGPPPPGCGSWSLRLLAWHVVALGLVASISHKTVRQTFGKMVSRRGRFGIG